MGIHPRTQRQTGNNKSKPHKWTSIKPQEPIGTNKRKKTSTDQFCQNYYILFSSSTRYHIAYNSVDHFWVQGMCVTVKFQFRIPKVQISIQFVEQRMKKRNPWSAKASLTKETLSACGSNPAAGDSLDNSKTTFLGNEQPFFCNERRWWNSLLLLLNLSSMDTYPHHPLSKLPKIPKYLFPINSAIIWVNSILGDWSLFILPLSPLPSTLSLLPSSQNSIADQAISCPGRQRQKVPGEIKKQSIIYIHTTLTDTPNQKCQFLAPNHQGAFFVGGGGGG